LKGESSTFFDVTLHCNVYNLVVLAQDSVLSPTDTFQSDFSGDDVKEREASESAA
jgi:hypothetical protein